MYVPGRGARHNTESNGLCNGAGQRASPIIRLPIKLAQLTAYPCVIATAGNIRLASHDNRVNNVQTVPFKAIFWNAIGTIVRYTTRREDALINFWWWKIAQMLLLAGAILLIFNNMLNDPCFCFKREHVLYK